MRLLNTKLTLKDLISVSTFLTYTTNRKFPKETLGFYSNISFDERSHSPPIQNALMIISSYLSHNKSYHLLLSIIIIRIFLIHVARYAHNQFGICLLISLLKSSKYFTLMVASFRDFILFLIGYIHNYILRNIFSCQFTCFIQYTVAMMGHQLEWFPQRKSDTRTYLPFRIMWTILSVFSCLIALVVGHKTKLVTKC